MCGNDDIRLMYCCLCLNLPHITAIGNCHQVINTIPLAPNSGVSNTIQEGNYAYTLLNSFSYEFWLNYAMVLAKTLHWLWASYRILCLYVEMKQNFLYLDHGGMGLICIHGNPENLAFSSAMWPLVLLPLVSPVSALGLVPPSLPASSSSVPAGPNAKAGPGCIMFSCQAVFSFQYGPVFISGLRTDSDLCR